jgi:hypothetical protein
MLIMPRYSEADLAELAEEERRDLEWRETYKALATECDRVNREVRDLHIAQDMQAQMERLRNRQNIPVLELQR